MPQISHEELEELMSHIQRLFDLEEGVGINIFFGAVGKAVDRAKTPAVDEAHWNRYDRLHNTDFFSNSDRWSIFFVHDHEEL